jgi:RimJ/RimL family protein N-acetyltransferase
MDFELQPTLTGKLLELRPLKAADFEELFAAASDPLIWEQHPENTRYKKEVFQTYFDGGIASGGAFVVVDRKSGKIIGSSRYCALKPEESEVEVGYTFLARAYWGGEYNREMKQLMLDHAFKFVERVVFVVGDTNWRSQKALAKIGASFWKNAEWKAHDGTVRKTVLFQITRD